MGDGARAFAAYSLRRGLATTSIRFLRNETEHWIAKEEQAGIDDWQLIEVGIKRIQP
jgi:hypothetical protein